MEALNQIKVGIITIGMIIIFATFGWMYIEGWDLFTSFYVSIITVSTVGYGDVTPQTFLGKLLSLIIVVSGVGAVAYTFSGIARFFIEGQFKRIIRLKKMQNRLKKLNDHYIICGFGKFGKVVELRNLRMQESHLLLSMKISKLLRKYWKSILI